MDIYTTFDIDNLFTKHPFVVDKHLLERIKTLQGILEVKYRLPLKRIIVQGARTDESNIEYYQNRYGEDWKKYYNKNSLHIVKSETGNILRAADIGFSLPNGERISGQIIYRTIQENFLFGNVGVAENYVHVDVLVRTWLYK